MLAWEGDRYDLPAASPADAIRALLDARGMRQGDLVGGVFPTKGIASEVLNGKRQLTYEHVGRLTEIFHVSPAVFYPAISYEDADASRGDGARAGNATKTVSSHISASLY